MTKSVINIGATANDRQGDSLRAAFTKVNNNFTELYTALGLDNSTLNLGAFEFTGSTMTTTDSTSIVIDQATTITSDLTVGGDIVPQATLRSTLGSPTNKFHSIYVGTGSVYLGDAKLSLEGGKLRSSVGFDIAGEDGVIANWDNVTNKPTIPEADRLTSGDAEVVLTVGGSNNPYVTFPEYDGGSLNIQGPEIYTQTSPLAITSAEQLVINTNGADGPIKSWTFGMDGSLTFPTLTVPIEDNANPAGTGQVLKFSDSSQQAIIFGPVSTEEYTYAERIIIQGAPGYTGTTGEGGDVYVWAGPGGSGGGGGGDIKIRAGQGNGSGQGGYLNFQAGDSSTGTGGYINIESGSGTTGGDIDMYARNGGNIDIRAVDSGTVEIHTEVGTWTFAADGTTLFPSNSIKNSLGNDTAITTQRTITTNNSYTNGTDFSTDVDPGLGYTLDGWYQRNESQIEFSLFGPSSFISYLTGLALGRTVIVTYATASGNQTLTRTLTQSFTSIPQGDPANPTWGRVSGRIDATLPVGELGIVSINFPVYSTDTKNWTFGSTGNLTFPNGETIVSQPEQIYIHKDDEDYVGEVVVQPGGVGIQASSLIDDRFGSVTAGLNKVEVRVVDEQTNEFIWSFNPDGSINLPTLTNTGYEPFYGLNGPTLRLGVPTSQTIITGPKPTSSNRNAQRLVIQGQKGYSGEEGVGEGGDVYIWGGVGGEGASGASGGDIKVRGGVGQGGGSGGYVKIEGGDSQITGDGNGGFVEITGGNATVGNGNGGNISVRAGTGNGTGTNGHIEFYTNGFSNQWQFNTDATTKFPYDVLKTRQDALFYIDAHDSGENTAAVLIRNFDDDNEELNSQVSVGISNVEITAGGTNNWTFNADGSLTVPPNCIIGAPDNAGGTGGYIQFYGAGGEGGDDNTSTSSGDIDIVAGVDSGEENDNIYGDLDIGNIRLKTRAYAGQPVNEWKFGWDGNLTLPASGDILDSTGTSVLGGTTGSIRFEDNLIKNVSTGNIFISPQDGNTFLALPSDTQASSSSVRLGNVDATGNVRIQAGAGKYWDFNYNGITSFPSNTIKTSGALTIKTPGGVPTGAVTKISDNRGWDENNVGTNLPTTGGTGTGLTVDVSDGGSYYSNITINTPGTGYTDGDVITVTRPDISETFSIRVPSSTWEFGTDGAITTNDAFTVNTPSGIPISITAITGSSGSWETNPMSNLATTGGTGTGLTVNVAEDGGYAGTITIATNGTGYSNGDVITVTSGSSNATFTISVAPNTWEFGTDGTITLPGTASITSSTEAFIKAVPIGSSNKAGISAYEDNRAYAWIGGVNIETDRLGTTKQWSFGTHSEFKIPGGVHEKYQALADATGTVTHDCESGYIFYHTSPDANWTANFTNLSMSVSYATTVSLIITQGGTGYYPNAVQIGGAAQTINWQGNTTPTPSVNRKDVVTFSILRTDANTYVVLGQLTGF